MRSILHIDMDAFFASVEQRDHPEWRGKPLIVGAAPHKRGVVSTCSYEARKFGVHSAMPSREAYRLCPQGIFVRGDHAKYEAVSAQVFHIFERFTPFVEQISIDEAFLDVSGVQKLFGTSEEIAKKIRKTIREELQLAASIGVASNKFLAKLGSEAAKPDGLFLVPEERGALLHWLGELPVHAIWGVGKVTAGALGKAGYRFVKDLQRANPSHLERVLGKNAATHLLSLAFGEDDRIVGTEREEKSLSREHTFLEDCTDREEIRSVLKWICEDVGRRLRERGLYAPVGRLKLRWKDFTTISRQAIFSPAVCDDFSIRELAFRLFDAEELKQPVRLIGFGVARLSETRKEQLLLFPEPGRDTRSRDKKEKICKTLDALREKLRGQESKE